jgi:hypothetical protein
MTASSNSKALMSTDVRAGAGLILAGAVILGLTWSYPSGTLSEIGPGAILQLAGGFVLLLGAAMTLRGLRRTGVSADTGTAGFSLRAFVIPAAMAVFAVVLPWLGLAATAAIATLVAGLGSRDLSLKERLASAVILSGFVTLLFGYGLRLQVPIWPWSP